MPLETTVNHIADLEPLYPFGTDNRLQGDNHIRNIKQALKNDIPLTTPATATGITLLTIASPAAARTTLGSTAMGDSLFTSASATAARATLGSTATGDALFTTADATAARTTLDVYSKSETDTKLDTPVVAATISASQTITTSTWTKVNFDTVTVNKIGTFSTANKRWTPGVAGTVRISAAVGMPTAVGVTRALLSIYKNGSVVKQIDEITGTSLTGIIGGTAILETNATDYFEIYAFITATTPTISGISSSAFDGEYIRS